MAWPVRYKMIGLLFCGSVINYVDRVNISVAAPVIMQESGWTKDLFGWVFSAFLIGYALLQLPGGVIADRWSGRKVLALAFCGFSLFTLLTPLGAHVFFLLLALRFLVGAFDGKIKTLWMIKGAQAYPGFKDAIDSLLADQTSEGRPSHVGVYCSHQSQLKPFFLPCGPQVPSPLVGEG